MKQDLLHVVAALPGWRVVYASPEPADEPYWTQPVALWAVSRMVDADEIFNVAEAWVVDDNDWLKKPTAPNYLGVIGPDEEPSTLEWKLEVYRKEQKGDSTRA